MRVPARRFERHFEMREIYLQCDDVEVYSRTQVMMMMMMMINQLSVVDVVIDMLTGEAREHQ